MTTKIKPTPLPSIKPSSTCPKCLKNGQHHLTMGVEKAKILETDKTSLDELFVNVQVTCRYCGYVINTLNGWIKSIPF